MILSFQGFLEERAHAYHFEKPWDKRWRQGKRWIELSPDDRKRVTSALVKLLISKGFGSAFSSRLVGEVCELKREKAGTELRDVKEYATLLNSTARYGYAEVGMRICMGDREEYLKKANDLLKNHRRHIVNGIQFVKKKVFRSMACSSTSTQAIT